MGSSSNIAVWQRLLVFFLLSAYATLALLPLLASGYYSDDLFHSTLKGQLELQGSSLATHLLETIRFWVRENGRFFPVSSLAVLPFAYLFTDLTLHKVAVLCLVITNLLLFFRFVEKLTKDFSAACLAALLMPVLFQFRLYHDPILSFSGMLQSFMLLLLLSAVLFQGHLEHGRRGYLAASLVAYNLCLYFYEISIPLALLFPILATGRDLTGGFRSALRKASPFLVSSAGALAIMLLVRMLRNPAAAGYAGSTMHLAAGDVARTLLVQLSATLPLSYSLFDPAQLFRGTGAGWPGPVDWVPVVGFAAASWYVMGHMSGAAPNKLLSLGGTLIFFPALLISLSGKYQTSLKAGLGYLPVYVQYFGLSLLVVWLLMWLSNKLTLRWRYCLRLVVCAGLSFCLLRTVQHNRAVVDRANIDAHYRRAALVKALKEGILAQVPDNATLLILDEYAYDPLPTVISDVRGWAETGYAWKNAGLVYQYAGKRLAVMSDVNELAKFSSGEGAAAAASRGLFLLKIQSYPDRMQRKEGFVVLSRIDGVMVDGAGKVRFQTMPLRSNFPGNV